MSDLGSAKSSSSVSELPEYCTCLGSPVVSLSGFAPDVGEPPYPCDPDVCTDWNKNVALDYLGKGFYHLTKNPCIDGCGASGRSHWYLSESQIYDVFAAKFWAFECYWDNQFFLYTGELTLVLFLTCNESTGEKSAIATLWGSGICSNPDEQYFLARFMNSNFLDCSDVLLTRVDPSCNISCSTLASSAVLNFE